MATNEMRLLVAVDAAEPKRVRRLLPKVSRPAAEMALERAEAKLRATCMHVPPELEGLRRMVAEVLEVPARGNPKH